MKWGNGIPGHGDLDGRELAVHDVEHNARDVVAIFFRLDRPFVAISVEIENWLAVFGADFCELLLEVSDFRKAAGLGEDDS